MTDQDILLKFERWLEVKQAEKQRAFDGTLDMIAMRTARAEIKLLKEIRKALADFVEATHGD